MKKMIGTIVGVLLFAAASFGEGRMQQDQTPMPQLAGTYLGMGVFTSETEGPRGGPIRMLVRQDGAEVTATLFIPAEDSETSEEAEHHISGIVQANGFVSVTAEPIFTPPEECGPAAVARIAGFVFQGSQALLSESYRTAGCGQVLAAAVLTR